MKIVYNSGETRYFDVNGDEIHAGDKVTMNGRVQEVVLTEDGYLGTDATNPKWIEKGWAAPYEYGVYPLTIDDEPVLVN